METIVSSGGRITIPAQIRRRLGMTGRAHVRFDVEEENKKIILTPITREYVHSRRGKYKERGLMKALMMEKAQNRE